jgi:hypothetical protein
VPSGGRTIPRDCEALSLAAATTRHGAASLFGEGRSGRVDRVDRGPRHAREQLSHDDVKVIWNGTPGVGAVAA